MKKEKKDFDRSNSTMKHIRFEDDLLEQINQQVKKDSESFSGWVKTACKMRLGKWIIKKLIFLVMVIIGAYFVYDKLFTPCIQGDLLCIKKE